MTDWFEFWMHMLSPSEWSSLTLRRIAIVLFPITGPLWFIGMVVTILAVAPVLIGGDVYRGVRKMWNGTADD